jgi:chromosome partitioning protein
VEIETLKAVSDLLRIAGNPKSFVVLNGVHPASTKSADDAREMVRAIFGLECAPVHLCHRQAYAEAPMTGQSPQELDADGKAGVELDRLFRFVIEHVKKGTFEHV